MILKQFRSDLNLEFSIKDQFFYINLYKKRKITKINLYINLLINEVNSLNLYELAIYKLLFYIKYILYKIVKVFLICSNKTMLKQHNQLKGAYLMKNKESYFFFNFFFSY